jgi:hypothetical protein
LPAQNKQEDNPGKKGRLIKMNDITLNPGLQYSVLPPAICSSDVGLQTLDPRQALRAGSGLGSGLEFLNLNLGLNLGFHSSV